MTVAIKFSHAYDKFPAGYYLSKLLDVLPVRLEDLSQEFLKYDTFIEGDEYYKLPKKGDYMILMLRSTARTDDDGSVLEPSQLWTTIRRRTPEKEKYYRGLIGQVVNCKIVKE
jgi:hypothetical protein